MVSKAHVKYDQGCAQEQAALFSQLKVAEINDAASRLVGGVPGNSLGDRFLRKTKTVTRAMPHSAGAAMTARQRMHSMMTNFGLPSPMCAVTPEDGNSFRIRIHSGEFDEDDVRSTPFHNATNSKKMADFQLECAELRARHPGYCAFEFEQVVKIVHRFLIGWNDKEGVNDQTMGVCGDIVAVCSAGEEQGRKTLHRHILLWVRYGTICWKACMEWIRMLGKQRLRSACRK